MATTRGSVARVTALRTVIVVSGVSAGVVLLGGSAVWLLERGVGRRLERIDEDADFTGGFADNIVRAFRMRMQAIRAATNETDFYALKSLHFEKLKGNRKNQHSMRLNQQFRLIVEIEKGVPGNTIVVIDIEDYH